MHPEAQPDRPHRFANGHVLAGRFRIVRRIGVGGMGEVYEAYDQELKETVALKLIRSDLALEPRRVNRFKQEIRNARRVSHPNVCRVYDLFQARDRGATVTFLTMEFVQGETLLNRIRREARLSPEIALPIIRQICAGLTAAHEQGIIHRDLKPANVLLADGANSRAVISDFGLAFDTAPLSEEESTLTIRDGAIGTPAYMAPEQIEGAPVTPATDIYALGLVVYEMVTGQRPFTGATPLSEAAKRLTEAPPPPDVHVPELPDRWKLTILRCLVRDPARRFQHAGEVVASLEGRMRLQAVRDTPNRSIPRKWLWAGLAAALVLAAMFALLRQGRIEMPPLTARYFHDGVAALRDGTYYKAVRALQAAAEASPEHPMIRARLAEAWNELEAPEQAREELLKASAPRALVSRLSSREQQHLTAIHQTVVRDYPTAVRTYEQLAESASGGDKAPALVDLGRALERDGRTNLAIEKYTEASRLAPHYAGAYIRQGFLFAQQREPAKSQKALDEAEKLFRAATNIEGLTEVAYQRGRFATEQRRLSEARPLLEEALRLATLADNPHQKTRVLMQLSRASTYAGNYEVAEKQARDAISQARSGGLDYLVPTGLIELAYSFAHARNYAKARETFEEALSLSRKNKDRAREALSLLGLGQTNLADHRREEGARQIEQAVTYLRDNGFPRDTTIGLLLLARYKRDNGDYEAALADAQSQAALADRANDPRGKAYALAMIGSVLLRMEDYPEAERMLGQSLAAAQSLGDHSLSQTEQIELAAVDAKLGRFENAKRLLDDAAKSSPRDLPALSGARAEVALTRGEMQEAASWARRYLSANKPDAHGGIVEALRMIAYATHSGAEAAKTLAASEKLADPRARAAIDASCAEIYLRAGDRNRARELAERALRGLAPAHQKESRLRAHAVMAQVVPESRSQHVDQGRRIWSELERSLGAGITAYTSRADIQEIRKFLQ